MGYFNVKNVYLSGHQLPLLNLIKTEHGDISLNKKPYDLLFLEAYELDHTLADLITQFHNDTLVIVNAIYKNKANSICWRKIKELGRVTVTVDMYYCGAVFFRKEQAEEHFTIRI